MFLRSGPNLEQRLMGSVCGEVQSLKMGLWVRPIHLNVGREEKRIRK